jgi:hypothetical protein
MMRYIFGQIRGRYPLVQSTQSISYDHHTEYFGNLSIMLEQRRKIMTRNMVDMEISILITSSGSTTNPKMVRISQGP